MAKKENQLIDLKKHITKDAQRRYIRNIEKEKLLSHVFDDFGHINGQHRFPVGSMYFGNSTAGFAACEVIAIYNVLKDIGRPVRLADLIFYDEVLGYMFFRGIFGTKIRKIGTFLEKLEVPYIQLNVRDFLDIARNNGFKDGQIFILTIMTRGDLPISPVHTFETVYRDNKWVVFNRFNNDERGRIYNNVGEILHNGENIGKLISVYKVEI